ncbi:response regulator transcription factor [Streptomyces apocyni]|uniref:response regulator transcription factor n=1 Tax=Streptomyces apocyni TaxID=2654677 RepID=UPI0012EAAFF7|nr:LuxR C-terminal-related transcriptional regulator [Streptomyces apocyni]
MRADQAIPGPAAVDEPQWKHALKKVNRLTLREREVFTLLSEGSSNQWMADQLKVTERTVRAHLTAIMGKLEIDSRMAACLAAYYFHAELSTDHSIPSEQHHASAVSANTVADDNGEPLPNE